MRYAVPPLAIAAATLVSLGIGADPDVAVMLLFTAVVLCALLGRLAGVLASVLGAFAFHMFVADPAGSLAVGEADDVITVVVFTLVAVIVGTLVAQADVNRRRAEQREREARTRLDLTGRLLAGDSIDSVARSAADAMVELFELSSCTLRTREVTTAAHSDRRAGVAHELHPGLATLEVVASADRSLDVQDLDILGALGAGLDTAFVRTALDRTASDARLEAEVSRTRAAFFAAAGHNLRTPLASVGAAAAALLDAGEQLEGHERTELLETIRDETDRLTRMVAKVLAASRIRAGAVDVEREPIDLQGIVQVAVRRLGPLGREHRYRLDIPADLGSLWLDPFMVEQILLNTLENAARFAPPDSEIIVSAARDGDHVELRIADHGQGIPVDERDRVFEEFYRGGRRAETEGTGLGLAIVWSLVAVQDGTVRVEQTPGGGATIVIRFPVRDLPLVAAEPVALPLLDEVTKGTP